jgi:hypothetical protein
MAYHQNDGIRDGIFRYQQPAQAVAPTDTFVKNIKLPEAAIGAKHSDGLGLYLHVKEAGK